MDEVYLDRCTTPDLTLVFNIPYEVFVERDDGAVDLPRVTFDAIQQCYLWWGKQLLSEGEYIVFVDGSQPEDVVCQQVLNRVLTILDGGQE